MYPFGLASKHLESCLQPVSVHLSACWTSAYRCISPSICLPAPPARLLCSPRCLCVSGLLLAGDKQACWQPKAICHSGPLCSALPPVSCLLPGLSQSAVSHEAPRSQKKKKKKNTTRDREDKQIKTFPAKRKKKALAKGWRRQPSCDRRTQFQQRLLEAVYAMLENCEEQLVRVHGGVSH